VLLDELMPQYHIAERHLALVRAAPSLVYAALRETDLAGGPVTRLLLTLRALPAAIIALVRSPRAALAEWRERRPHRAVRLADFERAGFRIVSERAPEELLIGLLGRFWTLRGALCGDVSVETFRIGPPAGQALAGWSFSVRAGPGGLTELRTETRVWCAPDAWPKFRLYWFVVRPGSGLVRRSMLRAIRRQAEQRHRPTMRAAS
jgi:hypothetical protein